MVTSMVNATGLQLKWFKLVLDVSGVGLSSKTRLSVFLPEGLLRIASFVFVRFLFHLPHYAKTSSFAFESMISELKHKQ